MEHLSEGYGSTSQREVHSNVALHQTTRKISNKQPNLPLKRIRKGSTNKTKSQQKEENKDQREIKQIKNDRKKIHKTKSWFFERINKIDKPLARLTKKRERTRIKIKSEKGEISTNPAEIHKTIGNTVNNLYVNKFDNLEEIDKFLETYSPSKLNQEEIDNLYRLITRSEIE